MSYGLAKLTISFLSSVFAKLVSFHSVLWLSCHLSSYSVCLSFCRCLSAKKSVRALSSTSWVEMELVWSFFVLCWSMRYSLELDHENNNQNRQKTEEREEENRKKNTVSERFCVQVDLVVTRYSNESVSVTVESCFDPLDFVDFVSGISTFWNKCKQRPYIRCFEVRSSSSVCFCKQLKKNYCYSECNLIWKVNCK